MLEKVFYISVSTYAKNVVLKFVFLYILATISLSLFALKRFQMNFL